MIEDQVEQAAAELWGLTETELDDVRGNLRELRIRSARLWRKAMRGPIPAGDEPPRMPAADRKRAYASTTTFSMGCSTCTPSPRSV